MAGAFTAVADDANGQLYNPAGLPQVVHDEVSLMSAQLYSGLDGVNIGLNYLGYVHPLGKRAGSIGVTWGELSSPSLYTEDTAAIGYGRYLNDIFGFKQPAVSIGANFKYLKHAYTLDERTVGDPVFANGNSAAATTSDAGLLVSWEKLGLSCGVACKNTNTPNVGLLTVDQVPNENVIGLAYYNEKLPFLKLPYFTTALDVATRDGVSDIRFGVETWLFDGKFAIRSGGSQEDVTFGLGYEIKFGEKTKLIVDYSFAWPLQVENSTGSHRFGLSLQLP